MSISSGSATTISRRARARPISITSFARSRRSRAALRTRDGRSVPVCCHCGPAFTAAQPASYQEKPAAPASVTDGHPRTLSEPSRDLSPARAFTRRKRAELLRLIARGRGPARRVGASAVVRVRRVCSAEVPTWRVRAQASQGTRVRDGHIQRDADRARSHSIWPVAL
jgi:hypothetical protein